jgi:hypothetical protein
MVKQGTGKIWKWRPADIEQIFQFQPDRQFQGQFETQIFLPELNCMPESLRRDVTPYI